MPIENSLGLNRRSMNVLKNRFALFLLILLGIGAVGSQTIIAQRGGRPLRPLTPADTGRFEDIGTVLLSPDGQWLAYRLMRSHDSGISPTRDALRQNQLGEVWIAPVAGGSSKKIFGGDSGGVGVFNLIWSPDSRSLAIVSTTPTGYAGLWVWEVRTERLQKFMEIEVAVSSDVPR